MSLPEVIITFVKLFGICEIKRASLEVHTVDIDKNESTNLIKITKIHGGIIYQYLKSQIHTQTKNWKNI